MPLMPPPSAAPAPTAAPMTSMPADQGGGDEVVATIYRKPDGTVCTEDAAGQRLDFPDVASAAQSIADMESGGEGLVGEGSMPAPEGQWGSES